VANPFTYRAPIAAFRNPLKPITGLSGLSDIGGRSTGGAAGQGLAEAIVAGGGVPGGAGTGGSSQSNLLQYVCRDANSPDTWSVQPFAGDYSLAVAIVTAITGPGAAGVNLLWIDNDNNLLQTAMSSSGDFSLFPATVIPSSSGFALTNLHVAYVPAPLTGGAPAGGTGTAPVVYLAGIQGSKSYLITVELVDAEWTFTQYGYQFGHNLAWFDLVIVPGAAGVSGVPFYLLSNVDNASNFYLLSGVLGDPASLASASQVNGIDVFQAPPGLSNPPMSGSTGQIAAALCNPAAASPSAPCAFYTDSDANLMMWPGSTSTVAPVPVPDIGIASAWGVVSPTGRLMNLYCLTTAGAVYLLCQLMWVVDQELPLFAPPSLVGTIDSSDASPGVLAPLTQPGDVPAVFGTDGEGHLFLYELTGQSGSWQGQYGEGQWTGGVLPGVTLAVYREGQTQ
jgi:hypothetical protein